jgi:hypothetical protein
MDHRIAIRERMRDVLRDGDVARAAAPALPAAASRRADRMPARSSRGPADGASPTPPESRFLLSPIRALPCLHEMLERFAFLLLWNSIPIQEKILVL